MMGTGAFLKVLRQNLRRNVKHLVLSAFGIVVGIAAFVFFWGLSAGVSRVVLHDIFPIDRVEVISPHTSFTGVALPLDDELVKKIQARPEVRGAYPKLKMAFPAKGMGNLMGNEVRFEVGGFCDGIDPALVRADGVDLFQDWEETPATQACTQATGGCPKDFFCFAGDNQCHHRVPVLVSRTLIELYNGSFAKSHGMPTIGAAQEAVLSQKMSKMAFDIALGLSFVPGAGLKLKAPPETWEAQLVGISDKAMGIGMTVPIGYLRRWNGKYTGEASARSYSSILVDLKERGDISTFYPWIKKEGYEQEDSQGERISLVITVVTALFLLIAFTIMFISALNISHTFFMMISERRREIGLMRALGASRADIWKIILGEAAAIGLFGGTIGVAAALAVAKLIDYYSRTRLEEYPFKPQTYFSFSPWLILTALGFAVAFCVFGAFLPARRAARIHPAQALSG